MKHDFLLKTKTMIVAVKAEARARIRDSRPITKLALRKPDSCGCVLIRYYDYEWPKATQYVWRHVDFFCYDHQGLTDEECTKAIFDKADGEQYRLGGVRNALYFNQELGCAAPRRWSDKREGWTEPGLRPDVIFKWQFTGAGARRVFEFDVVEKRTATRATRQRILFDAGAPQVAMAALVASYPAGLIVRTPLIDLDG